MKISRERQGEAFICTADVLWSLFPIIVVLSLSHIPPLLPHVECFELMPFPSNGHPNGEEKRGDQRTQSG